jgi:hypothetical protein
MMEWVVAIMPFGTHNAPTTFQQIMNEILRNFLHNFATAYLDEVCIYNRTLEQSRSTWNTCVMFYNASRRRG